MCPQGTARGLFLLLGRPAYFFLQENFKGFPPDWAWPRPHNSTSPKGWQAGPEKGHKALRGSSMWYPHAKPWEDQANHPSFSPWKGLERGEREDKGLSFSFLCRVGRKFPVSISSGAPSISREREEASVALGCLLCTAALTVPHTPYTEL